MYVSFFTCISAVSSPARTLWTVPTTLVRGFPEHFRSSKADTCVQPVSNTNGILHGSVGWRCGLCSRRDSLSSGFLEFNIRRCIRKRCAAAFHPICVLRELSGHATESRGANGTFVSSWQRRRDSALGRLSMKETKTRETLYLVTCIVSGRRRGARAGSALRGTCAASARFCAGDTAAREASKRTRGRSSSPWRSCRRSASTSASATSASRATRPSSPRSDSATRRRKVRRRGVLAYSRVAVCQRGLEAFRTTIENSN